MASASAPKEMVALGSNLILEAMVKISVVNPRTINLIISLHFCLQIKIQKVEAEAHKVRLN